MASSYVNDLRLNEMATGDASGTWGTVTNTNLELIGEALGFGTEAITTNADTHTSTVADGATDPARAMYIKYTGTLDSACTITIAPNTLNRLHFIENGTSGAQNIIISQGSGANITIPAGDTKAVYLDGAGSGAAVVDAFASLSVVDLKVQDDLTVTDDVAIGGLATVGGTLGVTGKITADAGIDIDNINIDGTTIALSSGDLTIDVAGDFTLDVGGGDISIKDDGTTMMNIGIENSDVIFNAQVSDKDIIFKGNDDGSTITALTLDMSDAGSATFSHNVKLPDNGVLALGAGSDLSLSSNGTNGTIAAPNGGLTVDVAGDMTLDSGGGNVTLKDDGTAYMTFTNNNGSDVSLVGNLSGDFTLNVAGDIILDADGGNILIKDGGTTIADIGCSGNLVIETKVSNNDFVIKGLDSSSVITALTIDMSDAGTAIFNHNVRLATDDGFLSSGASNDFIFVHDGTDSKVSNSTGDLIIDNGASDKDIIFKGNDGGSVVEVARFDMSEQRFLVGSTDNSPATNDEAGISLDGNNHVVQISRNQSTALELNRKGNDGVVCSIRSGGTIQGQISVSGSTVTYGGGHLGRLSRLLDNSKDTTIVKGTVMTNLDEMVEWITEDGIKEDNEQLNKMAVSSVEGDANVSGVFVSWDNDDDYNDMMIAMTGDMVIRIAKDTTVSRGDLLMSAGDGTAKPQGDDIVRSKTIAKVTSTNKSHTYDDGTYLVPCVLMAC